MCFKKKQTDGNLLQNIISEKIKIRSLNLETKSHFDLALEALFIKPHLARELDPKMKLEKALIISWLEKATAPRSEQGAEMQVVSLDASSKIAYLSKNKIYSEENHDNDIIRTYLNLVLKNKDSEKDFKTFQSFNNEVVIKLNFETQKGEEIVYRDKELDIPVYMLAKLDLLLKITDPYQFIKYIDVNIQQIGVELLTSKFMPVISMALRACMLKIIDREKICYYDLTKYYGDISKAVQEELQTLLKGAGVEICDTYVKSTSIPNGADKIFENQRIEFMQREKDLALHHKAEIMALENYERKAEIHNKYPNYELGLTEKEKDNAMDRYLTRRRGFKEEKFESSVDVSMNERNTDVGNIKKVTNVFDGKEDKLTANKFFKEIFSCIVAFVLLMIAFTVGGGGRFLLIALALITAGVSIASIVNKKKAGSITPPAELPTDVDGDRE